MKKKLLAACMVVAAFAAMPSLASANPFLTEGGTGLSTGVNIVATNVGNTTMVTSTGTLTCTTAILTGTLTANATAGGAKGEIATAKFGGTGPTQTGAEEPECTGSNFFTPNTTITPQLTMPWCLETAAAADTFTIKGGACGAQVAIKFALDVTNVGTCEYSRAATVNGTLVTNGGGANENTGAITSVAWTKIAGPALCPSEGSLTMRFSLETEDGTAIQISS